MAKRDRILPKLKPIPGLSARKVKRQLDRDTAEVLAKMPRPSGIIWPPKGPDRV